MKIVQSFWSCKQPNLFDYHFGWHAPEYHLMSWALSCLQLRQYYQEVELYTDQIGYDILIKKLQLPYTKVHLELDNLHQYHPELWALSKIQVYAKQDKPFLHVDGDVFIWEKFNNTLLAHPLIAQNLEIGTKNGYEASLAIFEKEQFFFPPEMLDYQKNNPNIMSYNAGILGGHDVSFFKDYATKAVEIIDRNAPKIKDNAILNLNVFYEQVLFYCLADKQQKKVGLLMDDLIEDVGYKGLGNFEEVPYNKTYLHLLGPFKRDWKTCKLLSRKLRQDYGKYHYKILELFPKKYKYTLAVAKKFVDDSMDLENVYKTGQLSAISEKPKPLKQFTSIAGFPRTCLAYSKLTEQTVDNETDYNQLKNLVRKTSNQPLIALFSYENSLLKIIRKFSTYNPNYLYARDLVSNQYYQDLFARPSEKITLVKDELIEIISSKWDWTSSQQMSLLPSKIEENLNIPAQGFKVAIIPEIAHLKYTELLIDELNELILTVLDSPKTIQAFWTDLKTYFDPGELKDAHNEFIKLIQGRLKELIFYKCIRLNYPHEL